MQKTTKPLYLALLLCTWIFGPSPAAAAECDTPKHRDFDFWLGEWTVHTSDGKLAGTNRIELRHGDCVLHESYSNDRGFSGESLNIYDAFRDRWHQTWVDNAGTLLLLEGGLRGDQMVLEGETVGDEGAKLLHRITWTPNADGSVRQHWQTTDAKGDWHTVFDGLYTRSKP